MIKVAVFGIVASLIAMKIKTIRPEIAILIAVISSILLAMYGLKQMEEILAVFETIRSYSKIPKSYFQILLKLIGISFICEFASNICKDAGQASIAKQIEFAAASLNDSEMVFKDRILYMVNIRKLRKGILPGILVTLLLAGGNLVFNVSAGTDTVSVETEKLVEFL